MEKYQNYSCPICHSLGDIYLKGKKGVKSFDSRGLRSGYYDYYLCKKCDILFNRKVLKEKELESSYQKAISNQSIYAALTYKKIIDTKINIDKNSNILEVASGDGMFLRLLYQNGYHNLIGIDPSLKENRFFKTVCETYKVDRLPSDSFDLILLFMSLEHIMDPISLILDFKRILKRNGILIIATHDFRWFLNKFRWSPIYDQQHLQLFSAKSINNLLTLNGFKIKDSFYIKNCYPLSYYLQFLGVNLKNNCKLTFNIGNFAIIANRLK